MRESLSVLPQVIKAALGNLPFFRENEGEVEAAEQLEQESAMPVQLPATNRPAVLADGSYATQVAQVADTFALPSAGLNPAIPNLRWVLVGTNTDAHGTHPQNREAVCVCVCVCVCVREREREREKERERERRGQREDGRGTRAMPRRWRRC